MPEQKPTLTSRRPSVKAADEDELRTFIEGAEEGPSPTPSSKPAPDEERYPWEEPDVSEDTIKTYLLRLPEPYLLKLRFIREQTGRSMQHVCLDAILPRIDEEVERITSSE